MIAFDFDDVVAGSFKILRQQIIRRFDFDLAKLFDDLDFDNKNFGVPGVDVFKFHEAIVDILGRYYIQIKPEPHAIESLQKFYQKYGKLKFITARNPRLKHQTNMWLEYNMLNELEWEVVMTKDKAAHLEGCKYFVDDQPRYAFQCLDKVDTLFMVRKPWNKNVEHEKIIKVNDLKEVCEILEI